MLSKQEAQQLLATLHEKTHEEKLALLTKLKQYKSAKRRQDGEHSLAYFITAYLQGMTPQSRPTFHDDMITLMQRTQNALQSPTSNDTGQGSSITLKEHEQNSTGQGNELQHEQVQGEGGEVSLGDDKSIIKTPPYFPHKIESPIDKQQEVLSDKEILTRLLFIAPRGFAKSTLCSIMFPMWLAVYGKKKDIFLVSATISLAKELLRKVRNELSGNEFFLEDFGEIASDKWTEDMLVLSNGTIIRAKGRGFQIRGFRPDMIICDDLEDEEVLYSKEQREKLETWFFRTLLPALKPDQGLLYVGTKLHQMALIGKLEKKEEFVSRHYKAITDGKSIWEELWSTERLNELKRELGTYAFEAEYQNNPLSLEDQPIKPHYLEGVRISGKPDVTVLAIDPAISEKTSSDYRAFVVMGRYEHGFKEIFSEKGRWGVNEQVDRIINIFERYKPDRIVLEEVAFQKIFRKVLIDAARKRGIYLPISEAALGVGDDKRAKDKVTRLLAISHLFEQKLVEIINPELKDELISFPSGDHDDLTDACVYALGFLMNYRSGKMLQKKEPAGIGIATKQSFYMNEPRPGVFVMEKEFKPRLQSGHTRFIALK